MPNGKKEVYLKNGPRPSSATTLVHPIRHRWREGVFILSVALSLFLLFALITYHHSDAMALGSSATSNAGGKAGAALAYAILYLFGYIGFLLPLFIPYVVWEFCCREPEQDEWQKDSILWRGLGFLLSLTAACGLASLQSHADHYLSFSAGGLFGNLVALSLASTLNFTGTTLLLFGFLLCGITLFTGFSWWALAAILGEITFKFIHYGMVWWDNRQEERLIKQYAEENKDEPTLAKSRKKAKNRLAYTDSDNEDEPILDKNFRPAHLILPTHLSERLEPIVMEAISDESNFAQPKTKTIPLKTQVKKPLKSGLPPLELLDPAERSVGKNYSAQALESMSREVELRLKDFGIVVQVVAVHPGPVVTRFEMMLAPGIKASRISGLAKDLARSLSVVSVRVVEVIPGKSVVGLELPNQHREIVRLSEVLSSQQYEQARSPLSLALGKDIAGHPVVVDLAKMPHLLVAGTTGSGKSVGLNAMLLSLLFKATPRDVRMIMIDPKMLELSIYEGIPHLLAPVVTDMKEAANALRWCVAEMEKRYRLMATLGVRNLAGYNVKVSEAQEQGEPLIDPFWRPQALDNQQPATLESLPYIVVIIDEFADMIMVVGKKVEELIARIAQKARAAGIHLILATQRPSVDVITGLIKANIPTRIAFQVSSKIDSRTILDQQGAEQLLGHGDMLYLAPGTGVPVRVHGAYVADQEVHKVVDDWKQRGQPEYIEGLLEGDGSFNLPGMGNEGETEGSEQDPLYDQAVQIVIETRRASISGVQRRLKIGYNRAARLLEEMEKAGLVSPMETNGSREVLVPSSISE